ncbi:hypothetical protein FEM48_Zijuj07G0150000 [Ziziphus jujuba var. spinosa]|uniref:PIPK domain-containing protein n=1 Tax=Ziziphus jujuba var. spinosa TaxID=714518 RepID=A0A978V5B4_ZIZJJ|nr:hypothetical protein FEM48_Zijuj07G0150000 [Ziziphus jujuba var. spinosa]
MKDFEKFGDIKSHSAEYLPTNIDFITRELKRVRVSFTSGEEKHIAAVFKDELTSIVACALAFLKDRPLEDNPLGVNIADDNVAVQSEACFGNFSLPLQLFSDRSSGYDSEPLIRGTIVEDCLDGLSSLRSSVTTGTRHPCIRLAFGEKEEYTVRCPYAKQFRELRSRCCSSEVDFIASLSHCTEWDAEGGKSKAFFAKTLDERLILKGIHRNEYNSFLNFANAYFDYMTNVNEENQSCLARVLGIYQVIDNVKNSSHLLIVMENLSWHRNFSEQYDLKGIDIKQRYVDVKKRHIEFEAGIVSGIFLLDKNFVERMTERPKFLSNDSREALTVEVMDYSLLVGVDDQRREFVCGIIDFFGPYTQCKCLESWCKSCFRVPTVLHPQQYSQRFFKFMRQHFLAMPTS